MTAATEARSRPILFSGPMVRAILEGRKTVTRRVVKGVSGKDDLDPDFVADFPKHGMDRVYYDGSEAVFEYQTGIADTREHRVRCPYGEPGDLLWVRETWLHEDAWYPDATWKNTFVEGKGWTTVDYLADASPEECRDFAEQGFRWRPSIHMPKWASRITLRVEAVRVERLAEISESDAIAEGFDRRACGETLREAAGRARMKFGRWLELPDGTEPDGYWCLDCAPKEARKRRARVCGWNDCFDADHAPRCERCGVMLRHSLTRYGIETELGLTDEESTCREHTPAHGDHALALAELAEGMGDWSDEYAGRLAQVGFATLWDRINCPRGFGWDADPFVWVVTFSRLEATA